MGEVGTARSGAAEDGERGVVVVVVVRARRWCLGRFGANAKR